MRRYPLRCAAWALSRRYAVMAMPGDAWRRLAEAAQAAALHLGSTWTAPRLHRCLARGGLLMMPPGLERPISVASGLTASPQRWGSAAGRLGWPRPPDGWSRPDAARAAAGALNPNILCHKSGKQGKREWNSTPRSPPRGRTNRAEEARGGAARGWQGELWNFYHPFTGDYCCPRGSSSIVFRLDSPLV